MSEAEQQEGGEKKCAKRIMSAEKSKYERTGPLMLCIKSPVRGKKVISLW